MAYVLSVSAARSRWAEVFSRAVSERHPVAIERASGERALLIGVEELGHLLAGHDFRPEVFFEDDAVSIWLSELALYGRGSSFEDAREDLIVEVREYVDEYLRDATLYLRAPGRAEQFPYVIKALVADAAGRLAEVLLAVPDPVAAT